VFFGFTEISTIRPPVTAGPMLRKVKAGMEIFLSESEALLDVGVWAEESKAGNMANAMRIHLTKNMGIV